VALELARQGAAVALGARGIEPLREAADAVRELGGRSLAVQLDVADLDSVQEAAGRVGEELGKVSVLVNNAGITRDQLLLRMKPEDWSDVLRINLDGTFHCTKVFGKDMIRSRWGRIINISSVVGTLGNAGQANYAASKAAVHGFTRSVARELAGRNITVNAIAPGYIQTAMTNALAEDVRKALLDSIPLARLGEPEDIARVAAFLAGDAASYITGQVIHVDGGMVMA
jgi:3-oxoacyl-[acyl-carrier protein] reductase